MRIIKIMSQDAEAKSSVVRELAELYNVPVLTEQAFLSAHEALKCHAAALNEVTVIEGMTAQSVKKLEALAKAYPSHYKSIISV